MRGDENELTVRLSHWELCLPGQEVDDPLPLFTDSRWMYDLSPSRGRWQAKSNVMVVW